MDRNRQEHRMRLLHQKHIDKIPLTQTEEEMLQILQQEAGLELRKELEPGNEKVRQLLRDHGHQVPEAPGGAGSPRVG